jgi:ADP-ribose pyrophosphatase YjhB (NUDIX family)
MSAADFDFSRAPMFRKTATLPVENFRIAEQKVHVTTRQPKKGGGEFFETTSTAEPGDWIVTRAGDDQYTVRADLFSQLWEIDPNNPNRYRSKNFGKAIRVDQDVTIDAPWGEKQQIKAGGVLFQSGVTGAVYGNQKETFEADYVRQAKDKSLRSLLEPLILQLAWAIRKQEPAHTKDIAERIAIRIRSRVRHLRVNAAKLGSNLWHGFSRAFITDIVKDGMVIDPGVQKEIIARAMAGNFGDQPSQTVHSLGTITTPDGKEVRIYAIHAADAIIRDPYDHVLLVTREYNPGAGRMAIPGGLINPVKGRTGESTVEDVVSAALREATEETGISARLLESARIVPLGHRSYNRPFDIRVAWADITGTEVKKGDFLAVSTQGFLVQTGQDLSRTHLKAGDDAKVVHVSKVAELVPRQFGIADHLPMIRAAQEIARQQDLIRRHLEKGLLRRAAERVLELGPLANVMQRVHGRRRR